MESFGAGLQRLQNCTRKACSEKGCNIFLTMIEKERKVILRGKVLK